MTQERYFDLHITGIGYLNRAREITVKRSEAFLAVTVTALHGSAEDVQRTYFDCRVSGKVAKAAVQQLLPAISAEKAVLVGFKLSDLYAEPFVYERGERQGETGVSLKARLLKIAWAKVDGQPVVLSESDNAEAARSSSTTASAQLAQAKAMARGGQAR